jgi:hypothetical protein
VIKRYNCAYGCGWQLDYDASQYNAIDRATLEVQRHNVAMHSDRSVRNGGGGLGTDRWVCQKCGFTWDYNAWDWESFREADTRAAEHQYQHALEAPQPSLVALSEGEALAAVTEAEALLSEHWYGKRGCGCPTCRQRWVDNHPFLQGREGW